ncbi:DUF2637 domain-containing protein [Microcella pacifica]|uniref:DUF2637 domain-containing protein n=1 Tax=Microcella pacifica TaxID=2591847 RepID=A0A9E5JNR8_9MICO|nr:DUF2637 domain-containing protein [Microcella pacifica]NHF62261.1 DUF2637 domain-containing protein [Microcella pacifica]
MTRVTKTTRKKHRTGAAETVNPDHIGWHRAIVAGVVLTLLAAVMTSWNGLIYVAEQQLLHERLLWLTPVMIDIPLIVLTLARGALRKRGIRARRLLVGILALTIFSSGANFLHTVAETGFDSIPAALGALTNALAPWLILAMTEVLWLVVTKPIRPPRPRAKQRRAPRARKRKPRPEPGPTLFDAEDQEEPDMLGALRENAA